MAKAQKTALTIAGFDPTGGAGIQADLKVFHSYNVYGFSAATSITAQNSQGVKHVEGLSNKLVQRQLDVLLEDFTPDALKTGVLFGVPTVYTIYEVISTYKLKNLVIDPVLIASAGVELAAAGTVKAIKEMLMPCAAVITPNIPEAQIFTALSIKNLEDMKEAARRFIDFGVKAVVIKGGHLESTPIDVFYDGKDFVLFTSPRTQGEYHGTGCVFSAAITANLALEKPLTEAIGQAKTKVTNAIEGANNLRHKYTGMKFLAI